MIKKAIEKSNSEGTLISLEEAEAISKASEFGKAALDIVSGMGKFAHKIGGEPVELLVGTFITDKLKFYRANKFAEFSAKYEEKLKVKGIENPGVVRPEIGVKILENASLEPEPEIQDLWANLLVNEVDPSNNNKPKTRVITIINDLEPLDAKILNIAYQNHRLPGEQMTSKGLLAKALSIDTNVIETSLRNLFRMGLIRQGHKKIALQSGGGIEWKGHNSFSEFYDLDIFDITTLGIEFIKSVS